MVRIRRRTHGKTEGKATSSDEYVMNTESKPMYKWGDIPWRKLEKAVYKLHSSDLPSVTSWRCQSSSQTPEVVS